MATNLSYGKRMLLAGLEKSGKLKRLKRQPPEEVMEYYVKAGIDQEGFQVRYVSDIKGYGVFSKQVFSQGDFLLEYVGEKISVEESNDRIIKSGDHNKMFFYKKNGKEWCIDAEETISHICQLVNDGPDNQANAVMKMKIVNEIEHLCLFARREIAEGEEILYNYGDEENLWWRKEAKKDHFDYDDIDSDPFDVKSYISESDVSDDWDAEIMKSDCMTSLFNHEDENLHVEDNKKSQITYSENENMHAEVLMMSNDYEEDDENSNFSHIVPVVDNELNTEMQTTQEPDTSNKEPDISYTEPDPSYSVTVHTSKKPERYCVYCKSLVRNGKLKRHITRKHKAEEEIKEILKQPKSAQNLFFEKKRKEGIFIYNGELMAQRKEPEMRERKPKFEDNLRVCLECNGYYGNKYFFKHRCVSKKPEALKPLLLQTKSNEQIDNDEDFKNILNRFRDGEVGNICRTDRFIKLIGYRHYCLRCHEDGKQDEVRKVVMTEMRELAKLLIEFKTRCGHERTVEDMFNRLYLSDLIEVIQNIVSIDKHTEKHGQKLMIDAVILRSLKTMKGFYSQSMQDEKITELNNFRDAYKHKSCEVYPKARQTCVKNSLEKSRKPQNLPSEAAVRKLKDFIYSELKQTLTAYTSQEYSWLRSLVVARLTLYNARRGEEAARMLQTEWEEASKGVWLPDEEIERVDDPAEQYLLGGFKLAYLKGKGRKYVPVLIPVDLIEPITVLNENRSMFGIKEENKFLFATRSGGSHCSGWHAVAAVCKKADIQIPINATKMRHRLSSVFASLDMSPRNQQIFLEHMGHNMNVNKENYQCPLGVQAVSVMGKMLSNVDAGEVAKQISMHSITIREGTAIMPEHTSCSRKLDASEEIEKDNIDEEEPTNYKKQQQTAVRWSSSDSETVRKHFKKWIFDHNSLNKGNLPSKQQILKFIEMNHLTSLEKLSVDEQYLKIRTKLFNDRKTMRTKRNAKLNEICLKKL